jgi:hypothetical protein
MHCWSVIRRFARDEDGFVVSTERLLLLAVVTGGSIVAAASLQTAFRNELLDEVDAVAACSNQIVFPIPAQDGGLPGTFEMRCTDDFPSDLATQVDRPTPTPADKEATLQFTSGDKEADPTP